MKLEIELYTEIESLAPLGDSWNQLLCSSKNDNIFLTWEWVSTWWQDFGREQGLSILLAREPDGAIAGIAPLKIRTWKYRRLLPVRSVEFIGFGKEVTPEHLNFIIRQGMEQACIEAFLQFLMTRSSFWDLLYLTDIPEDSLTLSFVQQELERLEIPSRIHPHAVCPYLQLPETWEAYMSGKSKNFRKKTKEHIRVLKRDHGVRFVQFPPDGGLEQGFETMAALHQDRWGEESKKFNTYLHFYKKVNDLFLKKDWLRLYFLEVDSQNVASLYCFLYNGVMTYYQAGRKASWEDKHVGKIIMANTIQEAIREKAEIFDFLRGPESYKYRWTDTDRRTFRVEAFKPGWKKSAASLLDRFFSLLKRFERKQS